MEKGAEGAGVSSVSRRRHLLHFQSAPLPPSLPIPLLPLLLFYSFFLSLFVYSMFLLLFFFVLSPPRQPFSQIDRTWDFHFSLNQKQSVISPKAANQF